MSTGAGGPATPPGRTAPLFVAGPEPGDMVPRSRLASGERRFELLAAGLLASGLVGVTAFVASLVVATMTAAGVLGSGAGLWVLVALLLTVLLSGAAVAATGAWLAWLAVDQLRTATTAAWRRLLWGGYRRAREFEERSPVGRLLRPARLFESRSDREGPLVAELKARYVADELDEAAFERELGRLLGGSWSVGHQVRREIEVTAAADGDDDDHEREAVSERSST